VTEFPIPAWQAPPADLELPDGEVHVWRLPLDLAPDRAAALARLLAPHEHDRAACFHFERDRRRFIVSHAGLRQILGHYLNVEPGQLRFTAGAQGKPCLADALATSGVQFNLSHSHELALVAVTRHRAIGIDVEHLRPPSDLLALAARLFSSAEYAALTSLPDDRQLIGFFNCWTRKEAYLKAIGLGMSSGLSHFQVTLKPNEAPRFLLIDDSPALAARWSLLGLEPAPDYIAAVALDRWPDLTGQSNAEDTRLHLFTHACQ
jgi:4'-phosphopantetheinyl transferase